MASENITLLAIGFSLLTLNILFGSGAAVAIARFFRFFGVQKPRPSRVEDYDSIPPASADDSEPPSHSVSGVRLGTNAGARFSESPRVTKKVAGTRR
jgi:hypothetical protein